MFRSVVARTRQVYYDLFMNSSPSNGRDKRRWPRKSLDVVVNYSFNAIAHVKDISQGGICLITDEPLTEGKMFTLRFTFPGDENPVELHGKVAWSRPGSAHLYENGISFWRVDADTEARLLEYLKQPAF